MTFDEFIEKPSSEKVVLCTIEASERRFNWTLVGGSTYKKTFTRVISAVKFDDTDLTLASSSSVISGEFYFDNTSLELFINNGSDPASSFISVTSKFFFANRPSILPSDLASGFDVEWDGRLKSISKFKNELDNEGQTGLALDGTGNLVFENTDGFFADIYDKLSWENKTVRIWLWSPELVVTESKLIFEGLINNKSFTESRVSFSIKDFISRLRDAVSLDLFSASDGEIDDSVIGRPKRRIYGEVAGNKVQSIDQILNGYLLAGTISGPIEGTTITGVGTSFLGNIYQGDRLLIATELNDLELEVETVNSDTELILSDELEENIVSLSARCRPPGGARQRNRTHLIAGHVLREPRAEIQTVLQLNRFIVDSTVDIAAGDFVTVNGERKTVRRIVANEIILNTNLNTAPVPTDLIIKSPVQGVFVDGRRLVFETDYTVTNTTEAKLVIDDQAEVNRAGIKTGTGTITMTNGLRSVTGSSTFFTSEVRPRDYIRIDGSAVFFEVLNVNSDTSLDLVISFSGTTDTRAFKRKVVNYIDDSTPVTCQCLGITFDGTAAGALVTTASDVCKHLLTEVGLSSRLNTSEFSQSSLEAPQKISLKLPLETTGSAPIVRDVINLVNKSVFGSVTFDNSFDIRHQVLSSKKPTSTPTVTDTDILNWSVKSDGKNIVKKVIVRYQHFDRGQFQDEGGAKVREGTSTIVSRLNGTERVLEQDVYLFEGQDAKVYGTAFKVFQRYSNAVIMVKSKVNFYNKTLNDPIFFKFDRLFKGLGGDTGIKLGLISQLSKDGASTDVEINDLSGLFNRVFNISSNTAAPISTADSNEKAFNGYLTDTNGLIDNDEEAF